MQTDCKQRSVEIQNPSVANPNELPNKGNPDYQDNAKPNNQAKNFSGGESTDDSTGQAVPACSSPSVFFNPDMRNFLEKEYDVSAVKVTRRKSHPSRKKGKQRHHSSSKTKPEVARDAVDNAKDGVENAKRDGVDNAKQDGMDNAKHDDVDNAKREDKKNDGVDDAKHDDKKHRLGARGAVKMPKAMVKKAMGTMKNAAKEIEIHKPSLAGIGAKLKLMEKPKEESSIKTALDISTITDKEANKYSFLRKEKKRDVSEYETNFEEAPDCDFDLFTGIEESSSQSHVDLAKLEAFFSTDIKKNEAEHHKPHSTSPSKSHSPSKGSSKPGLWFRKKASLRHFKSRKFSREKNFPFRKSGEIVKDNEKEKGKQREKEKDKEKAKQGSSENKLVGFLRHARTKRRRVKSLECLVGHQANKSTYVMNHGM